MTAAVPEKGRGKRGRGMTREEAIERLDGIRAIFTREAIDMAIEALTNNITESPNEAIKRQNDAIDLVRCKDCRYRDKCHKTISIREYDKDIDCNYARFERLTFCSYGEREMPNDTD